MKRFFALLLAALMLTACLPIAAFAAGSAAVTVDNVQAKAGQDVAVTFSVAEATFANYGLTITYDASVMTLTEVRAGTGYSGLFVANTENGVIGYANSHDQTCSGALFTAVFRVAEDAADGTYPVGLEVDFIADMALEDLTVTVTPGSVTVGETDAEPVPSAPEEMTFSPPELEETEPVPPDASVPTAGADDPVSEKPGGEPAVDLPAATAAPSGNGTLYIAAGVMVLALIAAAVIFILKRRKAE